MSTSSEKKIERKKEPPQKKTRAFFKKKSSSCSREARAPPRERIKSLEPAALQPRGFFDRLVFKRNAFFVSFHFPCCWCSKIPCFFFVLLLLLNCFQEEESKRRSSFLFPSFSLSGRQKPADQKKKNERSKKNLRRT